MSTQSRTSGRKGAGGSAKKDRALAPATDRQPDQQQEQEEFVMVSRPAPAHSAEEEADYQQRLATADRAARLGLDLPPVAPPGHHLQPVIEKPKTTFWRLLSRRVENRGALHQLYVTTVLMVVVPLGLMGLAYFTVLAGLDEDSRLTWSGMAGVLGVNIVAIGFGLFAYFDNTPDDDDGSDTDEDGATEAEAKRAKWEAWELAQEAHATREERERLASIREAHDLKLEQEGDRAAKRRRLAREERVRLAKEAEEKEFEEQDNAARDEYERRQELAARNRKEAEAEEAAEQGEEEEPAAAEVAAETTTTKRSKRSKKAN